ncbi:MAG: hypothetical protein K5636_06200 [Bacteroidales bacterium]|nr:hypothetical protein [Bacteroidales bacterium]
MERTLQNAPQTILSRVYEAIGFDAVGDDILRHLAIARVCQPMSKVATDEGQGEQTRVQQVPGHQQGHRGLHQRGQNP